MSEEPPKSESIASRKDLDDYIADPFNQHLFQDLEEFEWKTHALGFFEWFYDLVTLIESGKPSAVLQNLDENNLDGPLRLWFVYQLRNRFRNPLTAAWPTTTPEELPSAFQVIDEEYERLENLYPPDLFPSYEGIHAKASSAVASGKMTTSVIVNMLQKMVKAAEEKRALELQIRQSEREKIQDEISAITQEVLKSVKQPRQNPEFTTNRQVIALGFMLRRLGVRNIDKQTQADFIQFLTGRNNKEIYDRVRELDGTVYNKDGADAQYVKEWFRKLNWTELISEIDELLSKKVENL